MRPGVLVAVAVLLCFSAFFSGSETALFSIHRVRLRSMREEGTWSQRLVAEMLEHPGRLLTTILVGNMIVNVLIAILLGSRVEDLFLEAFGWSVPTAYLAAVGVCTGLLVFFGEISPKVFAVRAGESLARVVVAPLMMTDMVLAPIRSGLLRLTDALFRVTRFHELHAAPFITDDELKSVLSEGEAQGVIEKDEREMIQGILEFSDALLREVLVPRPDVIALSADATVADALAALREHGYSRMPVYEDDLDHVVGVLVAKDLLPSLGKDEMNRPVRALARAPYFVPATMTVRQFIRGAQRHRSHLAIVVDEYGGTEGIVTLDDALMEVVGDIQDEDEQEEPDFEQIGERAYRVKGSLPLDELSELLGVKLEDESHETVAGFLMNQTNKVPEPGDGIIHSGVRFTVEACDGKRASTVRIQLLKDSQEDGPSEGEAS